MKTFVFCFVFLTWAISQAYAQDNTLHISLAGNAYVTAEGEGARITDQGLTGWTNPKSIVSVYFHISEAGTLNLSLKGKGESTIKVAYEGKKYKVNLHSAELSDLPAGKIKVAHPGYVRIDLQGVSKTGASFGEISELIVTLPGGKANYVKDFSNYWGRRGPSVHFNYPMPQVENEWFYNEVTVPEEGDTEASYYMANGFGQGYFGIQFNSPTERRVLFSVWSPFDTQNPAEIPEEDKIKMLRKGEDVHIGEFGNEGSGGQSYLKYNWKAGNTYKFLMHIKPDGKGSTVYTAYFYATDENRWRLIASFLRPKTDTWYTNAHSFLENFSPTQGYLSRCVTFNNQWALGKDGVWREMTDATFTHDETAHKGVRLDYQGGTLDGKAFYLKNGGFFNESTPYGTAFKRQAGKQQPEIDFQMLENL